MKKTYEESMTRLEKIKKIKQEKKVKLAKRISLSLVATCLVVATTFGVQNSSEFFNLTGNKDSEASAITAEAGMLANNQAEFIGVNADIYVATTGSDEIGDGSKENPYASINKAVTVSEAGDKIYVEPGVYELTPIQATSNCYCGVFDGAKQVEIFGANEKTIIKYDANKVNGFNSVGIAGNNANSILRNLTLEYTPNPSQGQAVIGGNAKIENVFIRIVGSNEAMYQGGTGENCQVINCTFFYELGKVKLNDNAQGIITDTATNVSTTGTNIVVDTFGQSSMTTQELIMASKKNESFIEKEVGVFYGEHAWKSTNYALNSKVEYIEVGKQFDFNVCKILENSPSTTDIEWKWSVENQEIARIDENGVAIGNKEGDTRIIAYNEQTDEEVSAHIYIYQKQNIEVDICVSTRGNDELGNGTFVKPYASIAKAVEMAKDGDKIYIEPGEYELLPMQASSGVDCGVFDGAKQVEIFGANEKTIVKFDANKAGGTNSVAIAGNNVNSILRNLTIEYLPKASTGQVVIGGNARIENVFFRISGANTAAYQGGTGPNSKVINCTFFYDLETTNANNGAQGIMTNIATNVSTTGTNIITDRYGSNSMTTQDLINSSKVNDSFIEQEAGVFYGENSWQMDKYNIKYKQELALSERTSYIKVGEKNDLDVLDVSSGEIINQNEWTWKSSNEDIATVDAQGTITGKQRGEVTIVAENENGDKAMCIVYVISNNPDAITLPSVTSIGHVEGSVNRHTTIILKEDGTVWTVGNNHWGQLGRGQIGETNANIEQVKISENKYLTDVVKISTDGSYTVLAITKNGEVYGWGANYDYQLGQGNDTVDKNYATKILGLNNIIDVEMTHYHVGKAVDKNGNVYTWGGNVNYSTYLVGDTFEMNGTPQKLTTINNVVDVSTGLWHVMMLKGDGTVWTHGEGSYGSLGNGTTTDQKVPVQVKTSDGYLENIVKIEAVDESSTAIDIHGNYYTWGKNINYQLGNGTKTNLLVATKTELPDEVNKVIKIGGADDSIAIVGDNGKVYVTGYNGYGQLSQGNTSIVQNWTTAKLENGDDFTGALNISGTDRQNLFVIKNDGTVWATGINTEGQLGLGDKTTRTYLTRIDAGYLEFEERHKYIKMGETTSTNVTSMEGFNVFNNLISTNGMSYESSNEDIATVDSQGRITGKSRGEVTITATNDKGDTARCIIYVISNNPNAITLPSVTTIGHSASTVNRQTTIILKEDGTVWTVGNDDAGQLGRGTIGKASTNLEQVKISENKYLTDVIKISSSGSYTVLALTKSGEVYGWGANYTYQLGQGEDVSNKGYATKIPGLSNIIDVEMVYYHAGKALAANGDVYTWGGQYAYLVGDTFGINKTPQKLTTIDNVVDISTGLDHIMMLKGDGTVWVNGAGDYGKLGNGATTDSTVPVQVKTSSGYLEDIVKIKAADESSVAIDSEGKYYAWGKNAYYQLCNGANTNLSVATKIELPEGVNKVLKIGGGNDSIVILGDNGKIYMAGYNGYGQLSQGNTATVTIWTTAKNTDGTDFEEVFSISGGERNSILAIKQDGTVWGVGDNSNGQLGLGDTTNRTYLTQMEVAEFTAKEYERKIKPNENITLTKEDFEYVGEFNVFLDEIKTVGDLSFESQNTDVAIVDETGKVTGLQEGTAKIKVTNTLNGDETYVLIKVSNNETEPMLAQGGYFSLALKSNGTVWGFGDNQYGQLGNVDLDGQKYVTEPIPVLGEDGNQLSNIKMIAAGYYHSVALTEDGEVYIWGYNAYGQLGNGTKTNNKIPTKVNIEENIVDICAWQYRTVLLDEKGNVYVCGDGHTTSFVKVELDKKVIDISADLVLTADKKMYYIDSLKLVSGAQNVVKVLTGYSGSYSSNRPHYMALTSNGKIYSWGITFHGEAGNGTGTGSAINQPTPTFVKTPDGKEDLTGIVDVNVSRHNVMAIDEEGNLYTWGLNAYGQLGTGNTTSRNLPVIIKNVPEIEVLGTTGYTHNLVMDTEGYVWTTGANSYGQLGNGTTTNSTTFNEIGDVYVEASESQVSLYVGGQKEVTGTAKNSFNLKIDEIDTELTYHILDENIASYEDGKVVAKAVGTTYLVIESKELDRRTSVKIEVLPDGAVAVPDIQAGLDFEVALKSDGSVWTWGANTYGQLGIGSTTAINEPTKIESIEGIVKEIAVGDNHALALTEDGTVYSFGYNGYGQCGNGTTTNVTTPVTVKTLENKKAVELTNIVKVKAGKNVSFAIDKDFNLWAWGQGYGKYAVQVAKVENAIDVTKDYVLTAEGKVYKLSDMSEIVTVQRVKAIEEGYDHTVMLAENGTAYAIGNNTYGQLGTGNNIDSTDAVVGIRDSENVGLLGNIKDIQAGNGNTIAITTDGTVYIWGSNENNKSGLSTDTTTGSSNENRNLPVVYTMVENADQVTVGYNHTSIANKEGFVWNFGAGELGQLGNRENLDSIEPVMVGTYEIVANTNILSLRVHESKNINARIDYFNLIKEGNEGIEYTSYNNMIASVDENGNVQGIATGKTSVEIQQVGSNNKLIIPVEVLDADQIAKPDVETNGSHTIILKANGTVWGFGDNTNGKLGNGSNEASDSPVQVEFSTGIEIVQISAGETHNIALDSNGNVYTWGRNNYGQLGVTGLTTSNLPVAVTLPEKAVKVAAGNNFSLVIGESGKAYAFGYNVNGELGIGTYKNVSKPTEVIGMENVIDIAGGENHSVLVTSAGEIYTTGNNTYSQLGIDETRTNKFTKVAGVSNIIDVDAGDNHNVAITTSGDVYGWGSNIYGQLGLGDRTNRNVPTKVEDIRNIEDISAGRANTMLLENTGKIYMTGANTEGEIGDGTKDTKDKFVEVTRIPDAISVTTGNTYSLAIRKDGTVWGWGDYNHGEANKESKTNSEIPVIIGNDDSILNGNEIILKTSETRNLGINTKYQFNVYEEYDKEADDFTYESANPSIAEINDEGIIMGVKVGVTKVTATDKETKEEYTVVVRVIDNQKSVIPKVEGGNGFAVALKGDGTIWTWGYNSSGALGDGTYSTVLIPRKTNIIATYTDISVGKDFAVALRNNGTVWSWGSNSNGQLGIENHQNSDKPVQVHELQNIEQIAAGETHAVAVSSYGIIYGWGSNTNGELGLTSMDDVVLPTVIATPDTEVVDISAGNGQTAYVTTEGKVYGLGKVLHGELEGINNAIKVEIGEGYIVILTQDGEIYEYDGNLSQITGANDAIDISAQGQTRMYQNIAGEVFTWGVNTEGQLGTNDTEDKTMPTKVQEYGENAFGIGAGYDDTYIISNTGFVYASGKNNYGQLGNSTQDSSLTHTLVGDRNFELVPDNKIMTVNDVEDIEIDSNTFNVFNDAKKDKTQYTWESTAPDIVEVTEDGILTAKAIGTATIKATDKVTNETKEAIRVVMPIDEQRIEIITVDGEQAGVTGDKAYSVTIRTDENVADLHIETNDITDKISIDGGLSYTNNGILSQEIDVTEKTTNIPIRIQTSNGTEIDYTLEIIKQSKNVNLESLTVNGVEATSRNGTSYEVIVGEDTDVLDIVATAEHDLANVSINGEAYTLKTATTEIEMEGITAVIPISVQSEGGIIGTYMLTVYKRSALIDIEDITVNGSAAIRTSETEFNAVIERDADISSVVVDATYELANIAIGSSESQVHTATSYVETTEEATKVHILVTTRIENETGAEVLSREYVLTIYKARINAKIDILTVNGTTIIPTGNTYIAYVANNATEADVRVITALDTDTIQIGEEELGTHDVTKTVDVSKDENIYTIIITDGETAETQEYELIIRKPSSDTSIISITGENEDYEREAELVKDEEGTGDTENSTYELKVPQGTEEITLRVKTGSTTARISIDGGEFQDGGEASELITLAQESTGETTGENTGITDGSETRGIGTDTGAGISTYSTNNSSDGTENLSAAAITTSETDTNTDNTTSSGEVILKQVPVVVEAENGTTKEYTVNIIELNDDTTLKELTVNGVEATKSDTEENTYNFTLTESLEEVTVKAVTNSETASLYIVNGEYTMQEVERIVTMDSKIVRVEIVVKAESGIVERYYLNIEGLPDNTNATYTVDGEEGTFVAEESKYIFRVDSSKTNHTVLVETEDSLAKVKLAELEEAIGTATMELTNDDIGKQYTVTITAQDGTKETVTIELQEKESDAEIAYLTVNEEILEPDEDGNYSIEVTHDVDIADIFVMLNSNYATVSLEGIPEKTPEVEEGTEDATGNADDSEETGNTGTGESTDTETGNDDTTGEDQETIPANQPTTGLGQLNYKLPLEQEGSVTLTVRVTAEDGTEKTHTLTITKLNGNTNLASITVDGETVTTNEQGEYEYVIARKDTASVVVTAENEKSKVTIDEDTEVGALTQTVELTEETTVGITITAEDGTEATYQLHIRKISNDNILESVTAEGIDEDNIQATGENSFEIKVPITQETINVTGITRSDYASLKLSTEEDTEYSLKEMTRPVELPENQTDITIVVKAENGDLKEYTVSIVKVNSLDIENVAVDDQIIEFNDEEDAYIGWYNADGNVNVKISTVDKTTKIELIQNDQIIATEEGDLSVDLNTLEDTINLSFRVTLQDNSDYKIYNIVLNKKSTDNSIEFVKIDDVEIEQIDSGYDKVLDRKDTYTLDIKATNEYAQIKLDDGEYVQGELITQLNMASIEEQDYTITVKSQNGEEVTYPLHIRKISNDTSLRLVTVDDENADIIDENYHSFIKRNTDSVVVKVEATSQYASVVIEETAGDTTQTNTQVAEKEVVTTDELTTVNIKVTAENGEEKTYTLEIEKGSQDVSIEEITVNDKAIELGEDGVYRANVVDSLENAIVYVKTTNPYASIKINGIESEINGENTQTIPLNPDEKVQEFEIEVTAQDGTVQNYTLEITRLNDDNSLEYVKVNSIEITSENGSLYEGIIDATSSTAQIEIKANNANTELVYGEQTGKGILTINVPTANEVTELTFDAISENGSKKTYTIELTKKSNDNSIMQVLVNNVEATKAADGNYSIDVLDTVEIANIRVTTTNENATVRINSEETMTHIASARLALEEKETVVTITTTSETGIQLQTTLTITKKSNDNNVQIITVDEKEVTEYNERTHTYTAKANVPKNGYNVTIMAVNSEATITLGEDTAKGTLRTFVAVEGEGKELTFTVTSEYGTTQEYNLVIIKASDNINVSLVELNDVEILPVDAENGVYREIIPKLATSVKVRVKAEDTYAEVKIGDAEAEYNESIVEVPIDVNNEEVTIPVVVTAADGETIKTYNIILVRGNNNTNITEVQVEGERIGYENGKYSAAVEGGLEEAKVTITLADLNATVSLNGETGKGKLTVNVPLEGIQTIKEITVIAEDGTIATYSLEINKHVSISGTVITENAEDKHIALVQIYKASDTRPIKDGLSEAGDTREVIAEALTKQDGTFDIMVPEVDVYDVVITKPGYLSYTVTDIETFEGESSDIGVKELKAGDVVKSGQIEIDDLVEIVDNYGRVQELEGTIETEDGELTEAQTIKEFVRNGVIEGKTAEEILQKINEGQSGTAGTTVTVEEIRTYAKQMIFDLNEDGVVDKEDRALIKENYDQEDVEEVWVNPEIAQNGISVLSGDNTLCSGNTESTNKAQDKSTQTPNEKGFIKPMDCEYEITSEYGYRIHPITGEKRKHTGIDISGVHHTNIYAVADGEITYAGVQSGYGNCIEIKHTLAGGTVVYSFYAHLSEIDVEVGEKVSIGDKIGLEGGDPETDENAGSSTGHHLHFEIRTKSGYGYDVDPGEYIEF